ncbi:MAG: bifunctional UDP-3-O-[3-hydroxymyristoyl] N-acetylglucosamine deacetylase/3-hydroxyacyl-ACP dehydratase [Chitinispirillia bacterium]|nr:bifunctional UDP-3-O-[3-hydroxymyristoyl] N-acetylglucosamine deacetylase/3-hydroxyacyl-ACP dehydratase [Chitinispirillia bacterium]MCL2267907.1 bifunctional UDP-3-O-[3-hydroxymyristoyl] N-acetylglucosamine deacetylase/3-hydroxyacyl-ACP dehydratase [Chitinispirillia bacterium]
MAMQHTIGKSVTLTGVGLHTGVASQVTFNPAPEGYGIRFVRTDLDGQPEIPADIENVVDLSRGTAIGTGDVRVYTVEHVMSCFHGLGIDNCRVEVSAQEIPLMDGSAMPYVELVQNAGIVEQKAEREYINIDEPIMFVKGDIALGVFPLDHLRVTLEIDYKYPALGAQYTTMFSLKDYVKDFASSRTFCFLSEIQKLREQGLIKGGSLDSALVVQDVELTDERIETIRRLFDTYKGPIGPGENGYLNNTELRSWNEPCRHKALDLIGDLYLLGKPINAHILAARTGHAANIEVAKMIREQVKNQEKKRAHEAIKLTYEDITKILPHRFPFLLIDKVVGIIPDKEVVALKNVSFNEPYFNGHFPGNPVMPGVLQIEAIAQAAGIMGLYKYYNKEDGAPVNANVLFTDVFNASFRGIVRPGDVLRIEVKMLQFRMGIGKFSGKCYVDDKLVCEADGRAVFKR